MYRIASRTSTTRVDRSEKTNLENLRSNVATTEQYIQKTQNTINFTNVQKACTSLYSQYTRDGSTVASVGSGAFFYETKSDLTHGYLLTAAHCLLKTTSDNKLTSDKSENIYYTNPITNEWEKITTANVFMDGAADIAIIKTDINLSDYPECALELSKEHAKVGDTCFVCGNPSGIDNDSLTNGIVRDPHYALTNGNYIADAIHINAPGTSGNSGSSILNKHGKIIGLFIFGIQNKETFNGGPNLSTLTSSLKTLKTEKDNKENKRYLGINWKIPNPFEVKAFYGAETTFANKGVKIRSKDTTNSPFENMPINSLLLSVTINGKTTSFGSLPHQRTPGILLYSNPGQEITIKYIPSTTDTTEQSETLTLSKSYANISDNSIDLPLIGGAP